MIPIVRARLVAGPKNWLWYFDCPWCPHRKNQPPHTHHHGAGDLSEDPRDGLGHRVTHCNFFEGGYELVDADPEETERVIAVVRK